MAYLGILEGNARPQFVPRAIPRGTLASSRRRESVGPALFGSDLPESVLAAAKAATIAAQAAAKSQGISGPGIAAAGKNAYDQVIAAYRASLPTGAAAPNPPENTPVIAVKTQDELRTYYSVPVVTQEAAAPSTAAVPANVTQEDLRSSSQGSAPATSGKSFVVPVLAIAAAYFFLKG